MSMLIAIDPGDSHTGVAEFDACTRQVVRTYTLGRQEAEDHLANYLAETNLSAVVCEEWRLYADKATDQIGSSMPTCQLIGVIKYLARINHVPIYITPTTIKRPVRARLIKRGIEHIGQNGHEKDAELHGHYAFMRLDVKCNHPNKGHHQ